MYQSKGPNVDWGYMYKLHPAIHTIKIMSSHVEGDFNTSHVTSHTVPKKELDVKKLQNSYAKSGYHWYMSSRELKHGKPARDFETLGITKLQNLGWMKRWRHL